MVIHRDRAAHEGLRNIPLGGLHINVPAPQVIGRSRVQPVRGTERSALPSVDLVSHPHQSFGFGNGDEERVGRSLQLHHAGHRLKIDEPACGFRL